MPTTEDFVMNPSTYKQVVINAKKLLELGDLSDLPMDLNAIIERVQELEDKIINNTDPDTSTGDIINTDDGIKVIGIHVNTSNTEVNTTIDQYKQGVTFEFKNVEVIGLADIDGTISPGYCFLMTVKNDTSLEGEPEIDTTPFQIAYGNDSKKFVQYKRVATNDTTWGEWISLSGSGNGDWIQSPTMPEDQDEGGYWCEMLS